MEPSKPKTPETITLTAEQLVQLIRHLGHDMRAPLGAVISTGDMLVAGTYEPLNPKQAKAVERVRRSGRRVLAMLDDFVTYIKAEANQLPTLQRAFNLQTCLTLWCSPLQTAAEEKGLQFTLQIAPTVPAQVMGDENILNKIVVPIIWNAIAFTVQGEVRVEVDWQLPTTPTASTDLIINIQDTGSGISPDDLPLIFEPFHRGQERPQTPTAGAGLGLPVAQALATMLHGSVTVKKTDATGTWVVIQVPLKAEITTPITHTEFPPIDLASQSNITAASAS